MKEEKGACGHTCGSGHLLRPPKYQVLGLKANIAAWVSQLTVRAAQLVRHGEHRLVQLVLGVGTSLHRLARLDAASQFARGELLRGAVLLATRRVRSGFDAAAEEDEA